MKMAVAEILAGIFFFIFAAVFFTLARKFPPPMNHADLGPATFPTLITILIAALALALLIQGLKNKNGTTQTIIGMLRKNSVIAVGVLLLLYITIIPRIGYYFSTALLFPALLWFAGERSLIKIAALSASFVIFAKLVFQMLLGVPLP